MARMMRVYLNFGRCAAQKFCGKEPVQNTEPAWPGTHYVEFELAQFTGVSPLKKDALHEIQVMAGVVAGSITARRREVPFPGMVQKCEFPIQIDESVLIVRDDHDMITFWGERLADVRCAFMAAIGENYARPNVITCAEFEKSSAGKGE